MPLPSERPKCPPEQMYMVKEAQAELNVDWHTFDKYRELGLIKPINPGSKRPKFTGQAIMNCYDLAILL